MRGPLHAGFPAASHVGWWITVGAGVAVCLLGVATTGRWARRTAREAAAAFATDDARVPVGTC